MMNVWDCKRSQKFVLFGIRDRTSKLHLVNASSLTHEIARYGNPTGCPTQLYCPVLQFKFLYPGNWLNCVV